MKNKIVAAFIFCIIQLAAYSQQNTGRPAPFTAIASGKSVTVRCVLPAERTEEPMSVVLYRGTEKNEEVKAVNAMTNFGAGAEYTFSDVALPNGIYLYTIDISAGTQLLSRRTAVAYVYPAGTAPFINTLDATPKSQSNEVTLTWKIRDAVLAGNITVLRSRSYDRDYEAVAELKNNEERFTDNVNEANETFYYRLQVADRRTGDIIYSPTALVLCEYSIQPRRPQQVTANLRKNVPQISWINDDEAARGFYVCSRTSGDKSFRRVSPFIKSDSIRRYTWLDESAAKSSGKTFDYVVMSESNSYTASKSSDTVSVAIPSDETDPAAPFHVRFIAAAGNAINISWDVDSANVDDIDSYIVYEKKPDAKEFRPAGNNGANPDKNFVTIDKPAAGSSYTVRAVRGERESASATPVMWRGKVMADFGPMYIKAELINDALNISWRKEETNSIKEYRLYKWERTKFVLAETIAAGNYTVITGSYVPGQLNIYQLKAVDRGNLENEGSKILQVN